MEFAKMNNELFHLQQKIYRTPWRSAKVKLPGRLRSTSCRQHFIKQNGYIKIKERPATG